MPRPVPLGEYPPGVRCNSGEPEKASPFVAVHLPQGFLWKGRKSHSVSYMGSIALSRGTRRTKAQAESCVLAWSWAWWGNLSADEQSGILSGVNSNHAAKRQRVG